MTFVDDDDRAMDDAARVHAREAFFAARPRLVGIAYRVIGSTTDAEDVVQEAWLRWHRADQLAIRNPAAWLTTTVTRLSLDCLRARKRDQARYVGPWLPTPIVERVVDPERSAEVAESLTAAFMLMLERLTPDERATFLLVDVFGEPFDAVALVMGRSVDACRQLASRARRKVRDDDTRCRETTRTTDRAGRAVVDRFLVALATGDEQSALACLAGDAVMLSDGGPMRRAARRPVVGPHRIHRLVDTLRRRMPPQWGMEPAVVGGHPGLVVTDRAGPVLTMSFEVSGGRIVRILAVLNPEKLAGITLGATAIE
ncbi:MAG TPA: RNA polymerase sigma factor SigJ [Ilumatobacteraceae bacterium]|nr:RNA polymerase sigma factor SigJ [Ilumatobacteraceae bacterium]